MLFMPLINNYMEKRSRGRPPIYEPHISKLRLAFVRAREQAKWRGDEWCIDVDYWLTQWLENDRYLRKGRYNDNLMFCRIDFNKPWTPANTEICDRQTFLRRQSVFCKSQSKNE